MDSRRFAIRDSPAVRLKAASRLRIVVLGYIVRGPLGGMAWHHLQYVLGLARLGHDVYFIEDSDDYPSCYDPSRGVMDTNPSYGLAFATQAFTRLALKDSWCYYDAHSRSWLGPCCDRVREICKTADVVLNLSGVNPLRPWLQRIPRRALIDTDPAFTQVRHLTNETAANSAKRHSHFFSFAENIHHGDCQIPNDQLRWKPTRQPVVLNIWADTDGPNNGPFTTVMQWKSYASVTYDGIQFGMKSDAFAPFLDLPQNVNARFELAVGGPTAPRELLAKKGWAVQDPGPLSRDPWAYQDYIRRSKAEFSVAKHGYVVSRSGWFSERSACYLASGRPVVVQDTGFSRSLPSAEGIVSFNTPEEAKAAVENICANYKRHCIAAREIAAAYFDSDRVLTELLHQLV